MPVRLSLFLCLGLCLATVRAADHWAYQAPVNSPPPLDLAAHPVDAFLAQAQKVAGLKPGNMAEPRRWLERAAFTLTGLPPSGAQLTRLLANPDEATWKSLVDELLASPAYGERWARHWMDVARYADTQGYNFFSDNRYPFAYTYRDWLIRALNEDMPYERFVKLQIAADLVTDRPDHPDLAALGFLTVGPRMGELEMLDDRVDAVTRGFLASTVACARCHDHKTDPIKTQDFYSVFSIFENTAEPKDKPVIGRAANEADFQAYEAELAKLEAKDLAARQEILQHLRGPETLPVYLGLAWQALEEKWDNGKLSAEGFKHGRYRLKSLERWKHFLGEATRGGKAVPRLAAWHEKMKSADEAARKPLCQELAGEWLQAAPDSELGKAAAEKNCPLSLGVDQVREFMDQEDDNKRRERAAAVVKLQIEHPGSPPRAMSLADNEKWKPASVYLRGNPQNRSQPFERAWLSFLGGGKFPEGKSPRLSLAEKIADPANPLTARVLVNRVWGWHFGEPFAEPSDFGPQHPAPALRPLLDWLALRFTEKGGSLKELHRLLLTSRAFRLEASGPEENKAIDEGNAYFWKWNRRRADFEAMRDRLLATSGALVTQSVGGRSVFLENKEADARRSLYAFVDRYALPSTFVSFDLPHPDLHAPKRLETTVPQQALYFLNSALVVRQAEKMAAHPDFSQITADDARVRWIYQSLFQRQPSDEELKDALDWMRSIDPDDYSPQLGGNWEIRHAPEADPGGPLGDLLSFPLFAEGVWKTGPQLETAPIRWLHAHAGGGHTSMGHVLVAQWRSACKGQVKLTGKLDRPNPAGDLTTWTVHHNGKKIAGGDLPPGGKAGIDTPMLEVNAGDTLALALHAPRGDDTGRFDWNLSIKGRPGKDGAFNYNSTLKDDFPASNAVPPVIAPAGPWADMIQMLWSSNEFHYID